MRRRILYIEDDPSAMVLVREFLERSLPDVQVDVCTTEAGAEIHLNASCYDLIICDFCLPGATTGAVIAEKVLARDPDQPFYLMSEYIGDNVKAEAARVGLELHGKFSTVEPAEFLRRVSALLDRRPCAEAAAIADCGDAAAGEYDVTQRSQPGSIAESAEASLDSAMTAGDHRQERRAFRNPIRLSSPNVMAALASLGRV